ncbi:hypothetical protein VTN96DRAFT_1329 [Rasamsonia emersonii]
MICGICYVMKFVELDTRLVPYCVIEFILLMLRKYRTQIESMKGCCYSVVNFCQECRGERCRRFGLGGRARLGHNRAKAKKRTITLTSTLCDLRPSTEEKRQHHPTRHPEDHLSLGNLVKMVSFLRCFRA